MFSLRSSPSTLVCDLRDGWASSSTTAAVHLSAPRPHRPSVMFGFDVSYDGGGSSAGLGGDGSGLSGSGAGSGGGEGGSGGGGGARGAFSPAVSDYAGVFEAGFDPAQVRASMTNKVVEVATAQPGREGRLEPCAVSRRARGGIGGRDWPGPDSEARALEAGAFVDDDEGREDEGEEEEEDDAIGRNDQEEEEADFLFEMEGLKEPPLPPSRGGVREDDGCGRGGMLAEGATSDRRRGDGGGIDSGGGWGRAAAAAAAAATAAAAAGVVAATAAAGSQRSSTSTSIRGGLPRSEAEQGSTATSGIAVAGGVREGGGAGIGSSRNKNAALRKPRVIAPRGTRCLGGGMYRLRLSTSC